MEKTRVLVVDDSAVVRRLLTDIINAETDMEVAGVAANASIALGKVSTLHPHLITLDVEMPDRSGLELLEDFKRVAPEIPVIMFSAVTQKAAATTLEALARGAKDYVTKPTGTGSLDASRQLVRQELLPRIRALALRPRPQPTPAPVSPLPAVATVAAPVPVPPPPPALPPLAGRRVEILAVGSSTGGPNALTALFQALGRPPPVPVVITQHMPPVFTTLLAQRLSAACTFPFHEAADGTVLLPGHGYLAPGDFHLRVARDGTRVVAQLDLGAPENSCRPSVDVMLRSVASLYGPGCLAVVLTGMGQDGLLGCQAVRQQGGQVVVQDEATSVVWGMPGAVARAGLAQAVLPLAQLPLELAWRMDAAAPARGVAHVS